MQKRLFLAIVLSIFVLIVYSGIMSQFAPPPSTPLQSSESESVQQSEPAIQDQAQFVAGPSKRNDDQNQIAGKSPLFYPIYLQNNELEISISNTGYGIQEVKILEYDSSLLTNNIAGLQEWLGLDFTSSDVTNGKILSYDDSESAIRVEKIYRYGEIDHIIELDLNLVNTSNKKSYINYGLNIASLSKQTLKDNPIEQRYIEFVVATPDNVLRKRFTSFNPSSVKEQILWAGARDRYFCSIIKPLQEVERIEKSVVGDLTSFHFVSKQIELLPNQTVTERYLIFLGPQQQELLEALDPSCVKIINYGFFDPVSKMLLGVLNFINRFCKNWGLTLIVFSVLVFVAMSPLSIKSFSSMKRMQDVQPLVEALKLKYKDSPQKLNKEIMELYKEKKVNPVGGCFPILLQMPIFVSLFQLLMRFVDLKGTSFLWIKDLSEPDKLFVFSKSLPIVGNEFNVLPIIMIVTMLAQQKITAAKQTGAQGSAQQQKMMSLVMAVFFGVIFYHMPSGLVLYWSINSILMLVFQLRLFLKTGT